MTNRWAKRHYTGTREEVLAQLTELAEGWSHLGRGDRVPAVQDAIQELEAGAFAAKVGFTTYNIDGMGLDEDRRHSSQDDRRDAPPGTGFEGSDGHNPVARP